MRLSSKTVIRLVMFALLLYLMGFFRAAHAAADFTDLEGHWSEQAVSKALASGIVQGYEDGTFRPDNPVTRAEFVTMLNSALGLRDANTVSLDFNDVSSDDWFYHEVSKAVFARYALGVSDTNFSPNETITRQEAATMLARVLPSSSALDESVLRRFPDYGQVADFARTGLAVLLNKGYMRGYNSGVLAPTRLLTRAEAIVLINKVLDYETIIRDDVVITEDGVVLESSIVVGNVTIAQSLREGDATLRDVVVLSRVEVLGGGSDTVTLDDAFVVRLLILKEGSPVRVNIVGNSSVVQAFTFNENIFEDKRAKVDRETGTGSGGMATVRVEGRLDVESAFAVVKILEALIDRSGHVNMDAIDDEIVEKLLQAGVTVKKTENGDVLFLVLEPEPEPTSRRRSRTGTLQVTPPTDSTIKDGEVITVTAPGADDLHIVLWTKALASVNEAQAEEGNSVFRGRIADLDAKGIDIIPDGKGTFTIAVNRNLIEYLVGEDGDWKAGEATTWLITPETGGRPWRQYETWDGSQIEDALFVFELDYKEPSITLEDFPEEVVIDEEYEITVKVDPGSYADVNTMGLLVVGTNDDNDFTLEFMLNEPGHPMNGEWFPITTFKPEGGKLVYWFGPKEADGITPKGALLGDFEDTRFRLTWREAGDYEFTMRIMAEGDGGEFDEELTAVTQTVTVIDKGV